MFGGLRASVATDAFQFAFFGITLSAVLVFLVHRNWPGAETFTIAAWSKTSQAVSGLGSFELLSLLAAFFLGETLIPPYATRIFAGRSDHASRTGFFLAGLYGIPWFLMMVLIGIQLSPIMPSDIEPDEMLVQASLTVFPQWLGGLVFAALFAIIMSSLTSLLNSGAVSLTRDLLDIREEQRRLRVGRWSTLGLSVVSVLGGVLVPGLVEGLILCYTVWAPAVLPSVIFSLVLKNPRPAAGLFSIVSGALSAVVWHFACTGIDPLLPALAISLVAFWLGQGYRSEQARRA